MHFLDKGSVGVLERSGNMSLESFVRDIAFKSLGMGCCGCARGSAATIAAASIGGAATMAASTAT